MKAFFKKLFGKDVQPVQQQVQVSPRKPGFRVETRTPSKEPDHPIPFGYKCQWLAIKTTNTRKVLEAFNLDELQRSNWNDGIDFAYNESIFVTPVIKGWILVVGTTLPDTGDSDHPNLMKPLLIKLSESFGEVHYYGTHRVVEYHGWAKAKEGKIERAFSYVGDRGEVSWDEGDVSPEELQLNFRFQAMNPEDYEDSWFPSEEDVLAIAKSWSIDPQMEYGDLGPGLGYVGILAMNRAG